MAGRRDDVPATLINFGRVRLMFTLHPSTSQTSIRLQQISSLFNMSFDTPWFNQQDKSFFNSLNKSKIVHVIIAGDSDDFSEEVTEQWLAEGFMVHYVPLGNGGKDFLARIKNAGDNTGVGEQYAVVGNEHRSLHA
jgi:hypothetical protein